jgi:penicillin amidase
LVNLDDDTMESLHYKVADGRSEQAIRYTERIVVNGAPAVDVPVIETRWGPAIQIAKKTYAVHWVAHERNAVNLGLLRMEDADNAVAAIRVGQRPPHR